MTWQQATVTKKGLALQAKLIDGETLRFTKVVSGAGTVDEGALADAAAVTDERQTLTLQPPNTLEGARIRVPVLLNNIGLQTGYQMHQIGFYAADPDEGEILYAIAQDDTGDRIPSETEARGFAADWVYVFEFGNAENVNVQLDPAGLLSVSLLGKPGGVAQLADNGALPITQGGTGAGTAEGARANIGAAANRNLVDNWDFAYAIDQRGKGKSGGYTGNGYSLDRWLIHDQYNTLKVYLQDDCLVLDNPSDTHNGQSWLVQKAAKGISADVVTLSILVQSVVGNVWIRANEKDFVQLKVGLNTLTASPDTKNNYVYWFVVEHNAKLVARAVKTEQGTVSTLVQQKQGQAVLNDVFDYPAELAKCQRYQMPLDGAVRYRAVQVQADVIMFFVPTPVTMAATPTIEPEHIDKLLLYDWAGTPQTGFTFAAHSVASNGIIITATKTKHGLQDAFLYANAFMGAGAPMLSANL